MAATQLAQYGAMGLLLPPPHLNPQYQQLQQQQYQHQQQQYQHQQQQHQYLQHQHQPQHSAGRPAAAQHQAKPVAAAKPASPAAASAAASSASIRSSPPPVGTSGSHLPSTGYRAFGSAPYQHEHDLYQGRSLPKLRVAAAQDDKELFAGKLTIDPAHSTDNPKYKARVRDQMRSKEWLLQYMKQLDESADNPIPEVWRYISDEQLPIEMHRQSDLQREAQVYQRLSDEFTGLIGVFAGENIVKDRVVAVMNGYIMTAEEYHNMAMEISTGVDLPIGSVGTMWDYLRKQWRKSGKRGANGVDNGRYDPTSYVGLAVRLASELAPSGAAAAASDASSRQVRRRTNDGSSRATTASVPQNDLEASEEIDAPSGLMFVGDPTCIGANINDYRGSKNDKSANVKIQSFDDHFARITGERNKKWWVAHRGIVVLTALRDIDLGEELLTSYGPKFFDSKTTKQTAEQILTNPDVDPVCPVCQMKVRMRNGFRINAWQCTKAKCLGRDHFCEVYHDTCAELMYLRMKRIPPQRKHFRCKLHPINLDSSSAAAKSGRDDARDDEGVLSAAPTSVPGVEVEELLRQATSEAVELRQLRAGSAATPSTTHSVVYTYFGNAQQTTAINIPAIPAASRDVGPLVVLKDAPNCAFQCIVPVEASQRVSIDASSSPGARLAVVFSKQDTQRDPEE
jgi:ribosomal protein L37AE/L43A